jgi:hypothetical protein
MLEVRLWSSPHENSGRGRQYSTGSVSDLNLGKHPSIEAQVAHAPRTVPAPSQIMMAGPFSFAVANQGSWITLLQLLRVRQAGEERRQDTVMLLALDDLFVTPLLSQIPKSPHAITLKSPSYSEWRGRLGIG